MTDSSQAVTVRAPIVGGSGVAVVHHTIAAYLPGYRVEEFRPEFGLMPRALALRRAWPAALVHSTPDMGPWVASPDCPLVTTFHNFYLDSEYMRTVTRLRRVYYGTILRDATIRSVRRASAVTAVSHFTAELVRTELGLSSRPLVIHNGVDAIRFSPGTGSDRRLRVLFAGNPIRRKGVEHLVALADTLPQGSELAYTAGMRSSALETPATHGQLVRLPQRRHDEMPQLYHSSDILFFPTVREGLPLVVAEAMACGLPVVATDCSSLSELVEHGRGGFLFSPGDRAQMAAYLHRLIANPMLRQEMGSFNRARILERFTAERMVAQYRELFVSLGADLTVVP